MNTALLAHILPGNGVYFVLREPLARESFMGALRVLERRAEASETSASWEDHWREIQERIAGRSRWDVVAPPIPREELDSLEGRSRARATRQTVENVLRLRKYTGFAAEGLRYTLDVFNPNGEIEVPYEGAGEAVVALLMQGLEPEPGPIALRLSENQAFYELLKDLDAVMNPEHVCGTYSLMSPLAAYLEGRVDPAWRPWDFLFPLHVLRWPGTQLTKETLFHGGSIGMMKDRAWAVARADEWSHGRVLVQVRNGLDRQLSGEYFAVAKALGMIPVQQLVEGSAPPRAARA